MTSGDFSSRLFVPEHFPTQIVSRGLLGGCTERKFPTDGAVMKQLFRKNEGSRRLGLRLPVRWVAIGLRARHGLAGDRRATSVISPFVSMRAKGAISFSFGDLRSCLPRLDPAVQTCERK